MTPEQWPSVQHVAGPERGRWYPDMPPAFPGETDKEFTKRLLGYGGQQSPYDHRRYRQCALGWHQACSDPAGEMCDCCPCHHGEDPVATEAAGPVAVDRWCSLAWHCACDGPDSTTCECPCHRARRARTLASPEVPPPATGDASPDGADRGPGNTRRIAANVFGVAAAFAAPVAAAFLGWGLLGLGDWWHGVGLALLVLAVRPVGEMAAEAVCRIDVYPSARWWAWRVLAATGLLAAAFLLL